MLSASKRFQFVAFFVYAVKNLSLNTQKKVFYPAVSPLCDQRVNLARKIQNVYHQVVIPAFCKHTDGYEHGYLATK